MEFQKELKNILIERDWSIIRPVGRANNCTIQQPRVTVHRANNLQSRKRTEVTPAKHLEATRAAWKHQPSVAKLATEMSQSRSNIAGVAPQGARSDSTE